MKILLLNQDWFAEEFKAWGHEVVSAGIALHLDVVLPSLFLHIDSIIKMLPGGFEPEVIIWHDNSAPIMITGLEETDLPLLMYSVDTHHHADLHACVSQFFDHVFIAQRDYMDRFDGTGTPISWLPLYASRWVEPSDDKRFGATFVGTMNAKLNQKRVEFFDRLKQIVPIHIQEGAYWEIFPHADIVVNQTVRSDLNFRVFEAMMCGSLLLTERASNGLSELFEDGKHLVFYTPHDPDDAAAKIRELLANPARMRAIARAGREEVVARHTPQARAATVLETISNLEKRPASNVKYLAAMLNHSISSTLIQQYDTGMCGRALLAAMAAARAGLVSGEVPGTLEAAHMISAAMRYDRILRSSGGKTLILEFAEAFPRVEVLSLAKIRILLNDGRRHEAISIAKEISDERPEEVFARAESAIVALMEIGM